MKKNLVNLIILMQTFQMRVVVILLLSFKCQIALKFSFSFIHDLFAICFVKSVCFLIKRAVVVVKVSAK